MADNTAIVYRITHGSSRFQGESHAVYKPARSNIMIPITDLGWDEKSYSTSVASDYKSGEVYVRRVLTDFGIHLPAMTLSNTCTIRVY